MSRVGLLAMLAGCQAAFGIHHVDDVPDAAGCQSFTRLFDTCALPPPGMWAPAITLGSDATYDASTHLLDGAQTPYAVVTTPTGSSGGGGGGGGVGFIVLIGRSSSNVTGLVSPAPTMP